MAKGASQAPTVVSTVSTPIGGGDSRLVVVR